MINKIIEQLKIAEGRLAHRLEIEVLVNSKTFNMLINEFNTTFPSLTPSMNKENVTIAGYKLRESDIKEDFIIVQVLYRERD